MRPGLNQWEITGKIYNRSRDKTCTVIRKYCTTNTLLLAFLHFMNKESMTEISMAGIILGFLIHCDQMALDYVSVTEKEIWTNEPN
jgi:hypothetical protein